MVQADGADSRESFYTGNEVQWNVRRGRGDLGASALIATGAATTYMLV